MMYRYTQAISGRIFVGVAVDQEFPKYGLFLYCSEAEISFYILKGL